MADINDNLYIHCVISSLSIYFKVELKGMAVLKEIQLHASFMIMPLRESIISRLPRLRIHKMMSYSKVFISAFLS